MFHDAPRIKIAAFRLCVQAYAQVYTRIRVPSSELAYRSLDSSDRGRQAGSARRARARSRRRGARPGSRGRARASRRAARRDLHRSATAQRRHAAEVLQVYILSMAEKEQ